MRLFLVTGRIFVIKWTVQPRVMGLPTSVSDVTVLCSRLSELLASLTVACVMGFPRCIMSYRVAIVSEA